MNQPRHLVIRHLLIATVPMTAASMRKRMRMERKSESAPTLTFSPLIKQNRSHGNGSPTSTSKMLEPIEDETAMSPSPARATMTEVSRSGMDVPAARNVRPITAGGMPKTSPMVVANQTVKKEKTPIQAMAPRKVKGKYFSSRSTLTAGGAR